MANQLEQALHHRDQFAAIDRLLGRLQLPAATHALPTLLRRHRVLLRIFGQVGLRPMAVPFLFFLFLVARFVFGLFAPSPL